MPFATLRTNADVTSADHEDLRKALALLVAGELAKKHELTSVLVEHVNSGVWGIGEGSREAAAHLEVTVTAGTNTAAQKSAFLKMAMELLKRFIPGLHEATYIVVREISATDWGYDGRTQAARADEARVAN